MKKLLAGAMAAAMLASMTTVAFAADTESISVDTNSKIYKEKDGILYEVQDDYTLAPGKNLYIEILPANPGESISSKTAGQYKVVTDWNQGKDVFDGAMIEYKKVDTSTGVYNLKVGQTAVHNLANTYESLDLLNAAIGAVTVHDANCPDVVNCVDASHIKKLTDTEKASVKAMYETKGTTAYKYVATLKTKSSFTTKEHDFIGTVKVIKKSQSNTSSAPYVNIGTVVAHGRVELDGGAHDVDNTSPVMSFENVEDEIELLFGNTASFTVNGRNQSDLFLGYTEEPVDSVLDQNTEANIDFITFKSKPSFNRMGDFRLFADEDMFIYEITSSGLKPIKTTYDEDYDAYSFSTRSLTSYAISDSELYFSADDDEETAKPEAPKPEAPEQGGNTNKPNPPTGTKSAMNLAAALAVVSLTAAGALSMKKSK